MAGNFSNTLQFADRPYRDAKQARLIVRRQRVYNRAKTHGPALGQGSTAARNSKRDRPPVFRIDPLFDEALSFERSHRIACGRLTDIKVRGEDANADSIRTLDKRADYIALRRRQTFNFTGPPIVLAGEGCEPRERMRELLLQHSKDNYLKILTKSRGNVPD